MATIHKTDIDLDKNQIKNAVLENIADTPSSPVVGQIIYNTTLNGPLVWNGSVWKNLFDNTTTRLRGTTSGTYTSGDLTLINGTGIGITQSGPNFTITNLSPNIIQTLSQSGQTITLSNSGGSVTIPFTDWADIPNKPSLFPPSSHTHPINQVTGLQNALDDKADTDGGNATGDLATTIANSHTHSNKSVLDNLTQSVIDNSHTHTNKSILDATTASYTTAEKNKLSGIEAGAEVNVNADWNATSGDAEILNKPNTFTPSAHTHPISDIVGLQAELNTKLESADLDGFIYDVQYNSSIHTITFYQQNGPNLVIDLPIEQLIKGVQLVGNDLVFTFEDDSTVTVPLNTLLVGVIKSVNGLTPNSQGEIILNVTDIPNLSSELTNKLDIRMAGLVSNLTQPEKDAIYTKLGIVNNIVQVLGLSGNTITLSNGGGSISLNIANIGGLQTELNKIGNLPSLTTTNKNNLVDAINEVNGNIPNVTGFIPYTGANQAINFNTQDFTTGGYTARIYSYFERIHLASNSNVGANFKLLTNVAAAGIGNASTQTSDIIITLPIRTSTHWQAEIDILRSGYRTTLNIGAYSTSNTPRFVNGVYGNIDDILEVKFGRIGDSTVLIIKRSNSTIHRLQVNISKFYYHHTNSVDLYSDKTNYKVEYIDESELVGFTLNGVVTNSQFTRDSYLWNKGDFTQTDVDNWNTAFGWGNHAGRYLSNTISDLGYTVEIFSGDLDTLPNGNYIQAISSASTNRPSGIGIPRSLISYGARHSSDAPLQSDILIGTEGFAVRNRTNNIWRTAWHNVNLPNPATETWVNQQIGNIVIPTVNNGQLTLSTGTGLNGSATFTANQSGNSTFSVTVASTHKLPTIAEWNALPTTNTTYTSSNGIQLTGTNFTPVYGTSANTITQGNDSRLSNAREWTATVVTQAEAQAGTATTARKWTAQRVRQAILGWWNSVTSAWGRSFVNSADAAAGRTALGLGNVNNTSDLNKPISTATQNALDGKEDKSNKVTNLSNANNTTYPTTLAVQNAINSIPGGITSITYIDLKSLKTGNSLVPGTRYYITDREIWIDALETDKLAMECKRHFRIVKDEFYTPHTVLGGLGTIHYLGIYGQTIERGSVPNSAGGINIGDRYYAIWGGRMWARNSSGSDIPGSSDQTIAGGWTLQATTNDTYYESKIFNIKYNFDDDIIYEQADDRGNIVTVTDTGASYIDFIDWGNKLIFNNKCYGFRNNFRGSSPATIYNNYIDGYIANNTISGVIRDNSNIGNIYKNTNSGNIYGNSNNGNINDNSNSGNIINNSNTDGIINNSNNGVINNNSNKGIISINTNNGDIHNNSNSGIIYNNSNISGTTHIRFNTNNGNISGNRMNGSYLLQYNTNNGNIGVLVGNTTRNADVTDTQVNK